VATDESKSSRDGARGFGGLSSLVSDLDAVTLSPPGGAKAEVPQQAKPLRNEPQSTKSAESAPKKGIVGLSIAVTVGLVGALALVSYGNSVSSRSRVDAPAPQVASKNVSPPPFSTPAPHSSPSVGPQADRPREDVVEGEIRPTEVKPSAGQSNILSVGEIRYCLAEEIRLNAADPIVDEYDDSQVARFNTLVDDYNSRCGSFRYRDGALTSAQADLRPYEAEIRAEGVQRFSAAPRSALPSQSSGGDYSASPGASSTVPSAAAPPESRADRENLQICLSGDYPGLCKHSLLTPEQAARVDAAERAANYRTCISGTYPGLCKHSLLTPEQAPRVDAAERAANYKTCISGDYPGLCKHSLLTPEQAPRVDAAERAANYRTCISGDYPGLCKHSLLTPEQAARVDAAERAANFETCISGRYPMLCQYQKLSADQLEAVRRAERQLQ